MDLTPFQRNIPLTGDERSYFAGLALFTANRNVANTNMLSDLHGRPTGTYLSSFQGSANWDVLFDQSSTVWNNRTPINTILNSILNLRPNYLTTVDLSGWPLGYLCYAIHLEVIRHHVGDRGLDVEDAIQQADNFIKGLVLTGTARNYETDSHEQGENGPIVRLELYETHIREFPLDKVFFFNPGHRRRFNSVTGRYYNDRRTLEDLLAGEFGLYLSELVAKPGGSDISLYQLWDNCSIARRTNPPIPDYMFRRHGVTRTGGFGNILVDSFTFRFDYEEHIYTCYLPSGQYNCFDTCILRALQTYNMSEEEAAELIKKVKCERSDYNRKDMARRDKQFAKGYTSTEMKTLSKHYLRHGVELTLYYFHNRGLRNICQSSEQTYTEDLKRIFLLRVTDTGEIFKCESTSTRDTSGILHAITVFPYPYQFVHLTGHQRNDFLSEIENRTKPYLESIFENTKHQPNMLPSDLLKYVNYQKKRHDENVTRTLIFFDKPEEDTSSGSKRKRSSDKLLYYVFAYDLETVTNKMDNQNWVYEPFRFQSTATSHAPIASQIPFSAQWVPVNVSDSGRFLQRKIEKGWPILHPELCDYSDPIEEGCIYSRTDDVLLDSVVTEYGDKLLGKCVEDMLLHIAQWISDRGGKIGYLYAHNGVGFDAYIVLQYNRFKVKNVLKTPRGILSLTIRVLLPNGEKISLILRDTKVHVPGSLASLCSSFNVPKCWTKIEFPITLIHSGNCYRDDVMKISKDYGENDVKCLAFIVKRINESIMDCEWDPAYLTTKPPISLFLTLMSMVKAATLNHFKSKLGNPKNFDTKSVDIPILRKWLVDATFGGRVNAYARTFSHHRLTEIFRAYSSNDIDQLKQIHSDILAEKSGMQVLDVTSLYPTAQSQCPMPCGSIYFADYNTCLEAIDSVHCVDCERLYTLCSRHKGPNCELRPFIIIIVKNCVPGKTDMYRCMTPRKIFGTKKAEGLDYTLETVAELNARYGKEKMKDQQSYSNIDLYWMRKQGYTFDIVSGFGWEMSMIYQSFIEPAFLKRIEAKRAGNKVLSNTLKLMYNSTYGITVQKDIIDCGFVKKLPDELHQTHHDDPRISTFLNSHMKPIEADEYLCDSIPLPSGQTFFLKKKKEHIAEFFSPQSPSQIGCAVLAWSRHIMNLIMFAFPVEGNMTYTDTDSIAISDEIIQNHLKQTPGLINNASDAFLGSLKNDHLEGPHMEPNGKEPRVILSLIGTKKVKLHVTLNENGELKFYNTYKGLNPSIIHPETKKKMHVDYIDKIVTEAIVEIHQNGFMSPVTVNQWNKSMNTGVIIADHIQKSSTKTYLGHSAGSTMVITPVGNMVEHFIPHGISPSRFVHNNCELITDFLFAKKDKTYFLSLGSEDDATAIRKTTINQGFFDYTTLFMILDQYYQFHKDEYKIPNDEYRKIVEILNQ
jgi:hypothetical protein